MIRLVYFDYDNEQCPLNVPNNIDKCNYMNFSEVFVNTSTLKSCRLYHKIRRASCMNKNNKFIPVWYKGDRRRAHKSICRILMKW